MNEAPLELIQARIATPGWTPGRKDMTDLCAVWRYLDDHERESMQKRLSKIDTPSARKAAELFSSLDPRSRGELARPLLKAYIKAAKSDDSSWTKFPNACFADDEARVRKAAAQAIGSAWAEIPTTFKKSLIDGMIDLLSRCQDQSEKKALIDALGKSADARALAVLKETDASARSLLTLERDLARTEWDPGAGCCCPEVMESSGLVAWFTLGVDQIARSSGIFLGADIIEPGVLKLGRTFSWKDLAKHNLWRKAGVVIGRVKDQSSTALADVVAGSSQRISSATSRPEGAPVRIRLGRDDGRTRSFVWEFAEALSKLGVGIINDGRNAHWELRVVADEVVLLPLRWDDRRFFWRACNVDGSSDPTIAAALVQLAEIKMNDRVWDPFCGAGTELIIAKTLRPGISATGNDVNRQALDEGVLAANAANVSVQFVEESCLLFKGGPFNVILSNPPFGMRTVRGGARDLLFDFFAQASRRLTDKGRVVMLSHAPTSTVDWAEAGGLKCVRRSPVKLAGMFCEFQVFSR
jgi:predicted RNA methylase